MKQFKTLVALVLALALTLTLVGAALADGWTGNGGTKTITVNNAMNGETYSIYKLFDATTDGTNIAYTLISPATDVPSQVAGIFEKTTITTGTAPNTTTYEAIAQKEPAPSDDDIQTALKNWAAASSTAKVGQIACTAGKVEFTNLTDGYYVIVSSFNGTTNKCIGTSTTTAGLTVYEKNTTEPQPVKTVDDKTWSIGDRITYTVKFPGANYMGTGSTAKIVTSYTIQDTLPPFLSNVSLESVTINGTDVATAEMKTNFADASKKAFDIPWAKKDETTGNKWQSLYNNGTEVTIVYKATLTSVVNVGTANTNRVKVTPKVATPDGTPEPWNKTWEDTEEVFTYGAALKKTDGTNLLSGAVFQIKGLVATETPANSGVYTVTSYNKTATDYTGASNLTVPTSGYIYIIGLDSALTLTGQETVAPAGYNKLTSDFTLTTTALSSKVTKTTGYAKYDSDNNLIEWHEETFTDATSETQDLGAITPSALEIVNNPGAELPSTGGIGTTIFYVAGIVLVLGAAAIIIARRKAEQN